MFSRSIGTPLVLMAAVVALSAGSCSSSGGRGNDFAVQTWSNAAPNTTLAEFFNDADAGEKISITQHTGSATLSEADIHGLVDYLFFNEDPPDLSESTLAATGDGSDENPAKFKVTDTEDNDFVFRTQSTGDLEMVLLSDFEEPDVDPSILAVTNDDDPDVGDDVAALVATTPGEDAPDFRTLDFMSVVAWVTTEVPDEGATEAMANFGVGHMGLATPEDDIPTEGSATYEGGFAGVYVEPGTGVDGAVGVATGHADFTADFAEATVEGFVHDIAIEGVNLAGDSSGFENAGDIVFDDVTIDGNTFSGGVVPGEGGFAEFHEDSTGTLDGNFYGPVIDEGPEEAGVVLTLQDSESDDFVTGVIGARLD